MKRTGFARPTRERKRTLHVPIPPESRAAASIALVTGEGSPVQAPLLKDRPVRSEPYRRLVALMDCINCGKQGRSQHAHTNAGKAKGLKNDDRDAMPLCADEPDREGCHTRFDQYRLVPGGRLAHIELGRMWAAQTREAIRLAKLWPAGLPEVDSGWR
jgi:hypothetical protein